MTIDGLRDDVLVADRVSIWRFVLNDLRTNGFLVQDRQSGAIAIVDPGARAEDLMAAAGRWGGDVRWILVTHLHADHHAAVDAVREAAGSQVAGPAGGAFVPDRPVAGGETLELGTLTVQVTSTPGHSAESVSYQIDRHVFVGDLLFRLASGRTDGPGASTEALFASLREVLDELGADTVLWCGHGPPTTVGEERAGNPIWRVAVDGPPDRPVDQVRYRGASVPVLAWAEDYDGGRKALLELGHGRLLVVPGSQVEGGA